VKICGLVEITPIPDQSHEVLHAQADSRGGVRFCRGQIDDYIGLEGLLVHLDLLQGRSAGDLHGLEITLFRGQHHLDVIHVRDGLFQAGLLQAQGRGTQRMVEYDHSLGAGFQAHLGHRPDHFSAGGGTPIRRCRKGRIGFQQDSLPLLHEGAHSPQHLDGLPNSIGSRTLDMSEQWQSLALLGGAYP